MKSGRYFRASEPYLYGTSRPRLWFFTYARARGWVSTTRQNSASQSLSRITQLTWHFRESVSHRLIFDVVKLTCMVEPVGLNGSSNASTGFSPTNLRLIPATMRSHAMSANTLYFSCAG